jgi:NADPH2:quinone reductase
MTHAIRIHETGGPDVLRWEEIEVGAPGPGQVRLRQTAIGVNFVDIYFRTGLYPAPLPLIPGSEGVGVIEAVGAGVEHLKPGERVAYSSAIGAYAETRLAPANMMIKLPDAIADTQAAAMMLRGLTVQYLLRQVYAVKPGDTVLIHAAAGGVGLIFCQWAAHLGATVIGTVGSAEKAALAEAHGCHHPIVHTSEDFVARVLEITQGRKLPVVYDSIGKDTFEQSLQCLAPLGLMVSFGSASGPVPPFDLARLGPLGSLSITRCTLNTFASNPPLLQSMAAELFAVVSGGAVKINVNQSFALKDAADAHRALASRGTTGSTILTV